MEDDSPKRKVINYFKKNLKKGYTADSLKWALIRQGYVRTLVEHAIEQANKELAEDAPVLKEKPKIKYEIIDEYDKPVEIKKSWWQRLLGD
jgi:phage tail protein X